MVQCSDSSLSKTFHRRQKRGTPLELHTLDRVQSIVLVNNKLDDCFAVQYQLTLLALFSVGHILGIGDRHTSNILVHTKTGELAHIDFGYVFEQGKVSPSPCQLDFHLSF